MLNVLLCHLCLTCMQNAGRLLLGTAAAKHAAVFAGAAVDVMGRDSPQDLAVGYPAPQEGPLLPLSLLPQESAGKNLCLQSIF